VKPRTSLLSAYVDVNYTHIYVRKHTNTYRCIYFVYTLQAAAAMNVSPDSKRLTFSGEPPEPAPAARPNPAPAAFTTDGVGEEHPASPVAPPILLLLLLLRLGPALLRVVDAPVLPFPLFALEAALLLLLLLLLSPVALLLPPPGPTPAAAAASPAPAAAPAAAAGEGPSTVAVAAAPASSASSTLHPSCDTWLFFCCASWAAMGRMRSDTRRCMSDLQVVSCSRWR
jgi:hypothetical protein